MLLLCQMPPPKYWGRYFFLWINEDYAVYKSGINTLLTLSNALYLIG
jgi:hypothetical protein